MTLTAKKDTRLFDAYGLFFDIKEKASYIKEAFF